MLQQTPAPAQMVRILGIETSCDETAAGIVMLNAQGIGKIEANVIRSQWEEHRSFGGVVPEIAARAHVECLDEIIAMTLAEASITLRDTNAIAVAAGPGLNGGLLVGLTTAKSIATAARKPLIALNHLEAHALTAGLTHGLSPPYLLLLVSGGHTQIVLIAAFGRYHRLGTTLDDALGEAFDKTAKLLDLGFPGGPAVELHAREGNPHRFDFPVPLKGRAEPHFSFAGLKTAVRRQAHKLAPLSLEDIADLCASFERAVCDNVQDRIAKAYSIVKTHYGHIGTDLPLVAAGGVARNQQLRHTLQKIANEIGVNLCIPPPELCSDNGAMIAWAGAQHYIRDQTSGMDFMARARWPLDEATPTVYGHGKRGAKV